MDKQKAIQTALALATDGTQIDRILTEIGKYVSWEAKRAYLEAISGLETLGPHQGDDESSFHATAAAFVQIGWTPPVAATP